MLSSEHVADYNEDKEDTAHYGLNMFSSMTTEERKQYLGLNITSASAEEERDELPELAAGVAYPSYLLWPLQGAVTAVKNQLRCACGSFWAFAAVGAVETIYQLTSGVLRDFSEQEYLDCTYENALGVSEFKYLILMVISYFIVPQIHRSNRLL